MLVYLLINIYYRRDDYLSVYTNIGQLTKLKLFIFYIYYNIHLIYLSSVFLNLFKNIIFFLSLYIITYRISFVLIIL
ncbi:hypothetical protein CoNPh10_CDS0149 [Staphylococcus phage S-CoN_Ph10]|nr:hypothetical protein CoNPh10_CDS0149 [Staphylococcus phage S-CoN_Ph10]